MRDRRRQLKNQKPLIEEDIFNDIDDMDSSDLGIEVVNKDNINSEEVLQNQIITKIKDGMSVMFSEEQEKIIKHFGKPLNVLSCAGSGKSTVLIGRTFYMELYHQIKPTNMLLITFNTEASNQLEDRYKRARKSLKLPPNTVPTFKTFHALFYMLLKSLPKYKNVNVTSEGKYTYHLMSMVQTASDDKKEILDSILNHKSKLMNMGVSVDGVENAVFSDDINFNIDNYYKVVRKYNELKEENNEIDFDDMTLKLKSEIENGNTEIVDKFRKVYKYVSIDEYQDISEVQRFLMDSLIEDTNKFVTIGDDDQSIYGFRGSEPSYIREFIYRYPNAERLYLSTNYRCKSNILDPFAKSVSNNSVRVEKSMQAFNGGGELRLIPYTNHLSEVVSIIKDSIDGHLDEEHNEIGVLVRINSQRMLLADLLAEEGVPVDIKNINFSLRNNKVYKTIMGIIYAIKDENNQDFAKFCKPMFPSLNYRIFSAYEKEQDLNWYKELIVRDTYHIPFETLDLVEKIKESNNMRNMIGMVFKLTKDYYKKLADKGYGSYDKTLEVFSHLANISRGIGLAEFEESEAIKESLLRLYCGTDIGLKISTLHSVKGLEYDKVFLVGINSSVFPSEKMIEKYTKRNKLDKLAEFIEEERRLWYVGGTRAINELTILYKESEPSIFISELLNSDGVPLINLVENNYEND